MGHFERGCNYLHYLHHSLASGQITGKECSPANQQKIVLKICWVWSCPSEQDAVSPSVSLSHLEASISLLPFQSADRLKTTSQKTKQSNGPQPPVTQWNYQPCRVGPPKTGGSWGRGLTECGPLEKGMVSHFSILALRTPWTVGKVFVCVGVIPDQYKCIKNHEKLPFQYGKNKNGSGGGGTKSGQMCYASSIRKDL